MSKAMLLSILLGLTMTTTPSYLLASDVDEDKNAQSLTSPPVETANTPEVEAPPLPPVETAEANSAENIVTQETVGDLSTTGEFTSSTNIEKTP